MKYADEAMQRVPSEGRTAAAPSVAMISRHRLTTTHDPLVRDLEQATDMADIARLVALA